MSVWQRARDGRLTGVVGALPPAPPELEVLRVSAAAGVEGWAAVAWSLGLVDDRLVAGLTASPTQRLLGEVLPPKPTAALVDALRSRADRVLLISSAESPHPDIAPVLNALVATGEIPVLLGSREDTPLLQALRERLGTAAVSEGSPRPRLAELPAGALQVLVIAAARGPAVTLSELADGAHTSEEAVLVALQAASLRGIAVQDDGAGTFHIDPDTLAEVKELTLPTWGRRLSGVADAPVVPPTALEQARLAIAIGAWAAADRLLAAAGDAGRPARAALAWARRDLDGARTFLEGRAPEDTLGLLWDRRELEQAARLASRDTTPSGILESAAIDIERGAFDAARARIDTLLGQSRGPERVTALHLSAILALHETSADLARARMQIGEALLLHTGSGEEARLLEVEARLALRAGNVVRAAQGFRSALPALREAGRGVATARATAGLAATVDGVEDAAEVLGWLTTAMAMNRHQAPGLVWCQAAHATLLERVPADDSSSTDLRRVSMELNSLLRTFETLPEPEPL